MPPRSSHRMLRPAPAEAIDECCCRGRIELLQAQLRSPAGKNDLFADAGHWRHDYTRPLLLVAISPALESLQHFRRRVIVVSDDISMLQRVDKISRRLWPLVKTGSGGRGIVR